jgi:hypothetical protein
MTIDNPTSDAVIETASEQEDFENTEENAEEHESEDDESEDDESFDAWLAKKQSEKPEKDKKPASKNNEKDIKTEKEQQQKEQKEQKEQKQDKEPSAVKIVVDGKSVEIPNDKIPTMLQKALGAEKRFQEAANLRKETIEFVETLKSDPISALKRMGLDFDKIAEDYIYEKIQMQSLPNDQREIYQKAKSADEKEKELERYRRQEQQERERAEREQAERELEQQTAKVQQSLETQIIDAIEKSGLPRNQFTVSRIAQYMRAGRLKGYDISAYDVVDKVQEELQEAANFARKKQVAAFKQSRNNDTNTNQNKARNQSRRDTKRITSIYQLLE